MKKTCKTLLALLLLAAALWGLCNAVTPLLTPKRYDYGCLWQACLLYTSTAREQHLYLDKADAALMRGKRSLLVEDVISTGESLAALEQLVTQAGGIIAGRMAILAEGDAQARDDLIYLQKLPVFNADGSIKE